MKSPSEIEDMKQRLKCMKLRLEFESSNAAKSLFNARLLRSNIRSLEKELIYEAKFPTESVEEEVKSAGEVLPFADPLPPEVPEM